MREFFGMLVLCSAAMAQTQMVGNVVVRNVVFDSATATLTTKVVGPASVSNSTMNSPFTTYTRIYVVFPPQVDPPNAKNNTNFKTYVMTQSSIDGVTIPIHWSAIETSPPTTTPCSPVGTDACQQDSAALTYYHTYSASNWSAVDGSGCSDTSPYSSSQWFCFSPRKVNFLLFGITQGSVNSDTPSYVTGSTWTSATGASEDAINSINAGSCAVYAGNTRVPPFTQFSGNGASGSTVTVTQWASPPFVVGDTIWISGAPAPSGGGSFNVTTQTGASVTAQGSNGFTYVLPGQATANGTATVTSQVIPVVTAVQSWPVPYEAPYSSAYQAFVKAAIYHLNHLSVNFNANENVSQIAYVRPGIGAGGEAVPICTTVLTTFTGYTESTWLNWYLSVDNTVQSANPQMQILYSINAGDPDPSKSNADYATQEAGYAVSKSNSTGMYNGFGSQGMANADITGFIPDNCPDDTKAPDTGNNWGCMFAKYWSGSTGTLHMSGSPTTVPLELQQVDCSDPTGYTASTYQNNCFQGQTLPGATKNLRKLLPFATNSQNTNSVAGHTSIIELYNEDALLAFDPHYCNVSGGICMNSSPGDWFSSSLGPDTQYNFYINVGVGGSCTNDVPEDCYSDAINNAHGFHQ